MLSVYQKNKKYMKNSQSSKLRNSMLEFLLHFAKTVNVHIKVYHIAWFIEKLTVLWRGEPNFIKSSFWDIRENALWKKGVQSFKKWNWIILMLYLLISDSCDSWSRLILQLSVLNLFYSGNWNFIISSTYNNFTSNTSFEISTLPNRNSLLADSFDDHPH